MYASNAMSAMVIASLTLDRIVPLSPSAEPLCFGCIVSDMLNPSADIDLYSIDSLGADRISLQAINFSVDPAGPPEITIELFDPSGVSIGAVSSQINVTLTVPGQYTALIREEGADQTADYQLSLNCLSGGCGAPPGSAFIQVNPSPLEFGDVTLGSTSVQTLSMTNNGLPDTTISSIDIVVGAFDIVADEYTGTSLAFGESCTFDMSLAPVEQGPQRGLFEIVVTNSLVSVLMNGNGTGSAVGSRVGGSVTGVQPIAVICRNINTGQVVNAQAREEAWDCDQAGLQVEEGEFVLQTIFGAVEFAGTVAD